MAGQADSGEEIGLGLADAIGQVRRELEKAIEAGADSPVRFQPGAVELEFEIGFARTGGLSGGLQLSVLSFGARADRVATHTHRLKIALTPVDRSGRGLKIADEGGQDSGRASHPLDDGPD